ncbi:hypothetical protein [Streptomyces albipurpureus]|uniref:Uncharacterized protein n=1 Tax=Streptomyces albipurpureus TaxID=2897419 RepID=A0ABT0UVS7_9ACTN|nr:hypothetical protein [Streptomyces sp. CWNU-1]MCM2392683.1 hypothetical protein [Streptomyces sp. CWNU-1]
MTERIDIKPARPHAPLRQLRDSSFWGAGMGGIFTCYRIVLTLRFYRGRQALQIEASAVMPA